MWWQPHFFFVRMLPIPEDKKHALLTTLKEQHQKLVESERATLKCQVCQHHESFCFVNSLFVESKAFASTSVVLQDVSPVKLRSLVQIKRDAQGCPIAAITLRGPQYKVLKDVEKPSCWRKLVLLHSSILLFHLYCKLVYGVANQPVPALPALPTLPVGVKLVKFEQPADASKLLPPPGTTIPPSWCYVCWESVTCDVLFPCRVPGHACCRKCLRKLHTMWSSTEYEGTGTVRCPTCGCADGELLSARGSPIDIPNKGYTLRKQRKPQYARMRVIPQ